jgi:hypothetical protein
MDFGPALIRDIRFIHGEFRTAICLARNEWNIGGSFVNRPYRLEAQDIALSRR